MIPTAVFLVSYPADYPWLAYCLRSIGRHVTGADEVVVAVEEGDEEPTEALAGGPENVRLVRCRRYRGTTCQGYIGQQIEKLRAWNYTACERIVFLDCDMVFVRPVDLQTDPVIAVDGKPLLLRVRWEDYPVVWCTRADGTRASADLTAWRKPMAELLRFDVPYSTMVRPPYVFPRWMLEELWRCVGGEERLRSGGCPVEYNTMGGYALTKHADCFAIRDIDGLDVPEPCIKNFWSHGGFRPEVMAELERLGLRSDSS